MRRCAYYKRAAKKFLAGTRFKSPFEAVMAGVKTLEDWADMLTLERKIEDQYNQERRENRNQRHSRVVVSPILKAEFQSFA